LHVKRIVAVVIGLGLLCSPVFASPSLKGRLIGTWRLVSVENRESPDKPWEKWFGENPRGYIMYDATGHMAVQIEKMPPPSKFAAGDDKNPTAEEVLGAYLGYVAYFGTYTVDEKAGAVTHHVEGSLRPSYMGTDQVRPATFEGNRLVLSDGKTFRVVWERVQ
jgi:Lipocalin-like domain